MKIEERKEGCTTEGRRKITKNEDKNKWII